MGVSSITIRGVQKRFDEVEALRGIDLSIEKGTVLGLLGPNGAGKTTLIRILTTLMQPDEGSATIEGFDVVEHADEVRKIIGLAGQYAAVDENLTGRENLIMVGRLYHLSRAEAATRAAELLIQFDLDEAADRSLKTYSGGMRRRLDLAASLVNRPPVLFLDEPTTGLDPQSRLALWKIIRELVDDGTTVLLTTQYLEEAERMAHRIVVIDRGLVLASGTPAELKSSLVDILELHLADIAQVNKATAAVRAAGGIDMQVNLGEQLITVALIEGPGMLQKIIRSLDIARVELADLTVRHPSLDDVFLKLTGHKAEV
ncbi:ATP-binding cassette domain-containing protein [Candidatus Parcubacteria bacterium]|nr:MAG: ATP-binding cassette domain-containing protein [Candidatus Parcubacteria bacterium]